MSTEATPANPTIGYDTVDGLFRKFIGPLMGTGIVSLMEEPDNIEERVQVLIREFNAKPHLINPFKKLVASLQNREGMASTEEQIRFFSTSQTRIYIIANLMNDVLNVKNLKLDLDSGRLPGKPNDLLKYAYTARLEFGEESRYKELSFASGLLFDFAFYLQKSTVLNYTGPKLDEFINQSFKKGMEEGKMVAKLTRNFPNMQNDIEAPMVPLLRQLSHVIFCLIHPQIAIEFFKKIETLHCTEPFKMAMEIQRFGIHSGMMGAYIAQSIPIFEPLSEVMSVVGTPYHAHYTKNKAVHDMAALCELCIMIRESYKLEEIPMTEPVGTLIPELKFLDFVLTSRIRDQIR